MTLSEKIYELYKPLRNKFAELKLTDTLYFIWATENNLQFHKPLPANIPRPPKYMERGDVHARRFSGTPEWELEFILSESIINSEIHGKHSVLEYEHLRKIVNGIRVFNDEVDKLIIQDNPSTFHEFFRMAHRQFEWQDGPDLFLAYRYFRMHSQPELEPIFTRVFGLTPIQYYTISYSIAGFFTNQFLVEDSKKPNLPGITDAMADLFVKRYSKSLDELRNDIKAAKKYDERLLYCYNAMRGTPIISFNNKLCCPMKALLLWQTTRGVFYSLVNEPEYGNALGKAFEEYTGYIIGKVNAPNKFNAQPEIVYATNKGEKKSSDWIVEDADGIVFYECKAKRISMAGKIELDIAAGLKKDIDEIAAYLVKMYNAYLDYKNGLFTGYPFKPDKKVFLQIISLEEWHFLTPQIEQRLKETVITKLQSINVDLSVLTEAPYFLTSISQFEWNFQLVYHLGVAPYFQELAANTIQETRKKYKLLNLVKDDMNNEFITKLGIGPI
jgi:hypothetical protein